MVIQSVADLRNDLGLTCICFTWDAVFKGNRQPFSIRSTHDPSVE